MAINFYKVSGVKKHLDKFDDTQVQYTGMGLRKHILICGATGSGKSNCLLNYIYLTSKGAGTFKHVFCCVKTKDEPLYQYLRDQLKDKISFYTSVAEFPDIEKFPENQKDNFLIIMDDCIGDKDKKSIEKLNKFYIYGRKLGCQCIYLSQSYYDVPLLIRRNVSYVILCSIRSRRDLNMILKEYSNIALSSDELFDVYKIATHKEGEDDMPFLKITTFTCPKDKKFSRYFTDYIPISQLFPSEDGEE